MKIIRITAQQGTWRPDLRTLYHFGDYRVPLDMSEELAARALAEGVAELVREAKPDPVRLETKPAPRVRATKEG
jgi:hypothetical protein